MYRSAITTPESTATRVESTSRRALTPPTDPRLVADLGDLSEELTQIGPEDAFGWTVAETCAALNRLDVQRRLGHRAESYEAVRIARIYVGLLEAELGIELQEREDRK